MHHHDVESRARMMRNQMLYMYLIIAIAISSSVYAMDLEPKPISYGHIHGQKFQEGLIYGLEKRNYIDNCKQITSRGSEIIVQTWLSLINGEEHTHHFKHFMLSTFDYLEKNNFIFFYIENGKRCIGISPDLLKIWDTFANSHVDKKSAWDSYQSSLNTLANRMRITESIHSAVVQSTQSPFTFYMPVNDLKLPFEELRFCGMHFMRGLTYALWLEGAIEPCKDEKGDNMIQEPSVQDAIIEAFTYLPQAATDYEKRAMIDLLINEKIRFRTEFIPKSPLPPIVQDLIYICSNKPPQDLSYMRLVSFLQAAYRHGYSAVTGQSIYRPKYIASFRRSRSAPT
jgi:hypothetical protein